jgi:hypothetical protein
MQTQSATQLAEQAQSVVAEVRECAAEAGVDEASAAARAAGERSNQEQALLEAVQVGNDVAVLIRRLNGVQHDLDTLLEHQRVADAKLNRLAELQRAFRERLGHFYTVYTNLESIAEALVEVTGNPGESCVNCTYADPAVTRRIIETGTIVGIPIALGELIGGENAEERLRGEEKRVVQEMLSAMQALHDLLEDDGYDAGDLGQPIANAQTFLAEIDNTNRDIHPEPMLVGMTSGLDFILSMDRKIATDLAKARRDLEGIGDSTREAFDSQQELTEKLQHALDRANTAKAACLGNPFGFIPGIPDWNSTFWDISSP